MDDLLAQEVGISRYFTFVVTKTVKDGDPVLPVAEGGKAPPRRSEIRARARRPIDQPRVRGGLTLRRMLIILPPLRLDDGG